MGLGKTLEMISLIVTSFENGEPYPVRRTRTLLHLKSQNNELKKRKSDSKLFLLAINTRYFSD